MTDIPHVLGNRYEVGELIGRGGMAEVHIGYDTRLSRTVAIKVLRSDLATDPTFLARFRREAQSAAALNHPSIVAVYDTGEEHTTSPNGNEISLPYIVMEYVKGRTVSKLLNNGDALPINEAVQIVVGVLSALEYSHREGIIHRDIKPGNIMLTTDGKVKVMDFGIARAVADSAATMTQTNSVVGTAQYLSPEQARGEVVDTRSDLYSTGCVLYELLTGRPPFQGDSAVAVAYQHVSEAPKPAQSIAPDIPDALDRVVMKSLAKRREDRYQTAAEMRADLLAASRGEGVDAPDVNSWQTRVLPASAVPAAIESAPAAEAAEDVTSTTTGTAVSQDADADKQRKRNRLYIIIGVILLVLALLGLGWAIMNSNRTPGDQTSTTVEMVTVPDLSGMDQTAARARLETAGLTMNIGSPVEDDTIPAGEFVSSRPGIGESVERGTAVEVSFSSGLGEVEVPNVTNGNYTQDEARRALEAAGLAVGNVSTRNAPGVGADIVVSTDPSPGTPVAKGSEVSLVISSGKIDLPNVTGKNVDEATAILRDEYRIPTIRVTETETVADTPGTVMSMSPGPGVHDYNVEVELIVAKAPPATTPPPTTEAPPTTDAPTSDAPTSDSPSPTDTAANNGASNSGNSNAGPGNNSSGK